MAARLREQIGSSTTDATVAALLGTTGPFLSSGLRKTFDYASIVISLYGLIEDYVETLVEDCAREIEQLASAYVSLPETVRRRHEELSLKLAEHVTHKSYDGPLTFEGIVESLHECLAGAAPFRLNREAFSLHTVNVREDLIRTLFANLGLTGVAQIFSTHHEVTTLLYDFDKRPAKDAFFYIDDLADRRNVIAHGERPQDVLSTSALPEYFRAVRVFGQVLFEGVFLELLRTASAPAQASLGTPTAIYQKGRVVCFQALDDVKLYLGAWVLWKVEHMWRVSRIESIEVDHVSHSELKVAAGTKVGIKIGRKGSPNATYGVCS